jgi:hypothetical protein
VPAPPADEYPFTNHRTMAEVMRDEQPCKLDGRNCPPDHDHPAFGEGDETTYEPPKPAKHIHRWKVYDTTKEPVMACIECNETHPIVDQKPGQYTLKVPKEPVHLAVELIDGEKYPCHCRDMDRCMVENHRSIGNNVFCRKAEAGL